MQELKEEISLYNLKAKKIKDSYSVSDCTSIDCATQDMNTGK